MSYIKKKKWALLVSLCLLGTALVAYANWVGDFSKAGFTVTGDTIRIDKPVTTLGTATVTISSAVVHSSTVSNTGAVTNSSTVTNTGAVTNSSTTALNGVTTIGDEVVRTADTISLTSPTVTFTANGANLIVLNSDGNQTGHYPTGGALYQEIQILAGAGSNTMRFDDGTSLTLGANVTLTEGQGDMLTLICTSADGDEWTRPNNDN